MNDHLRTSAVTVLLRESNLKLRRTAVDFIELAAIAC